jgi:hypothetical protein
MPVKVIAIDDQDRVKLSRKAALRELGGGGPEGGSEGGPGNGEESQEPRQREHDGPSRRGRGRDR